MLLVLVLAAAAAASALPVELLEPGHLALVLNEDDWDDYLDAWLANENERRIANVSSITDIRSNGCVLRVNGDLGQPQPVYLRNNRYLEAVGTTGQIHLSTGEEVLIACTGSGRTIVHPNIANTLSTATAHCVRNSLISGAGWLHSEGEFLDLKCSSNSGFEARTTTQSCYNNNTVIEAGFDVSGVFYPVYWSCFDQNRLEVLYTWYTQTPPNAVHQTGVIRPGWLVGGHFPGVAGGINSHYTQVQQKATIANLVGQELADKYVTRHQYLARGHLAAKTDFVLATGQRATFFFINAAPQWQPFNAGNWNWLEQNMRARIGEADYYTKVYTGTFGVTQLRDANGVLHDVYLYRDDNNNQQLPVPLYFYKVVYEESTGRGTAFVSINNPYYTEAEVRALTFCTDRCRNNSAFSWLRWQPDRVDIGYSFCCEVDDFRRTVPHLPAFTVTGLLT